MLYELKKLLDAEADLALSDMRQTASVLLERQFLYADQSLDKKHYHRVIGHIPYFSNLFDALNRRLVYDQEFGMVGILPLDGAKTVQLPQEEALFLLSLRLLYEEGVEKFEANRGSVFTDSETLLNRYQTLVRRERPGLVRLRDILRTFSRFGLIEVEDEQDRVIALQIRPALRLVTTEGYLSQLEAMLEGREEAGGAGQQEEDDTEQEQEQGSAEHELGGAGQAEGRATGQSFRKPGAGEPDEETGEQEEENRTPKEENGAPKEETGGGGR